jgi:hypothetical protein
MKRNTILTFLNSIKLLKSRSFRKEKLFALGKITPIYPYLPKVISLSLGRDDRLKCRIKQAYNFISFVTKMYRNHGDVYTIKWLKANHVALQK